MQVVSISVAKKLVSKREYDVILCRHKQHTSSNNDNHAPMLGVEILCDLMRVFLNRDAGSEA